jgi:hypothetical protein
MFPALPSTVPHGFAKGRKRNAAFNEEINNASHV